MVIKLPSLVKPTLNTKFHIDFDWWKNHDRDWRIHMRSFLCPEHQAMFSDAITDQKFDLIDQTTAEVKQVDALEYLLITHCAKQDGFLSKSGTLVDSVFKVFLTNGNQPLTPTELSVILSKPAQTILTTFGGLRVYKGIRPIQF